MASRESNVREKIKSAIQDQLSSVISDIINKEMVEHDSSRHNGHATQAVTPFLDLQNGFYNGLCQGLGLSPNTFQILQPSPPLVQGSDRAVWDYFNNIPPNSLTQNYIASGGNQFLSDYKGLISALKAPKNTFKEDIGEAYNPWLDYIRGVSPAPAAQQMPDMFSNWAMLYYPDIANIGSSDLASMLLDPISTAGLALMPYLQKLPDWTFGYNTLLQQLVNAPRIAFTFNSKKMNTDVSQTWSAGNDSGFFGLWGSSSSSSALSEQFASSQINIDASFAHVLTFGATPGVWYTSSAMGLAFSHQSGDPWRSGSSINWQNTFDPQKGNLTRFMVNLIVVDTMNIMITSSATFSSNDQQIIQNNSSAGLWPFYTNNNSSGASTSVQFDEHGAMTVQIVSKPNVPVVIGGNVLPVSQYVGHAVEAEHIARELRTTAGSR